MLEASVCSNKTASQMVVSWKRLNSDFAPQKLRNSVAFFEYKYYMFDSVTKYIKINKKMITWGDVLAGPLIRALSYISLNKRPIVIDGIVSFFLDFIGHYQILI